jgi:hypothetical protein
MILSSSWVKLNKKVKKEICHPGDRTQTKMSNDFQKMISVDFGQPFAALCPGIEPRPRSQMIYKKWFRLILVNHLQPYASDKLIDSLRHEKKLKKTKKNQQKYLKPGLHPWHQRVKLQEKYIIQFSNFYIKFARSHKKKKHFQVFIALIAFFFSLMTALLWFFFVWKLIEVALRYPKVCLLGFVVIFWNFFKSMVKNFILKFAEILQE